MSDLGVTDNAVETSADDDGRVELWFLRWPRAMGVAPIWLALGLAVLIVVGTLVAEALADPIVHQRVAFERRIPFLMAFVLVYTLASMHSIVRGAEREFDAMRPRLLGTPNEIARARRALSHYGRTGLLLGSLVGIATMAVIQEFNVQRWSRFASGDWNAFDAWVAPVLLCVGAVLYQSVVATFATARSLARVSHTLLEVRLFDPDLGRPIARFGLRIMLLYVVGPALTMGAFQLLNPGAETTLLYQWIVSVTASSICLALLSSGLRARTRELKRAELQRVDKAVHGDVGALVDSPMQEQIQHLGLVDLLAYRREVDAIREWPIDATILSRFAFYTILPPASWVAAALMERFVDRFMLQ